MDLAKVLAELKRELENLDAAIVSLERLQSISRKRGAAVGGDREGAGPVDDSRMAEARSTSAASAVRARVKARRSPDRD